MENRKKMARAAILAATIAGGVLMFAQPFEAQAYSGGKFGTCENCKSSNGGWGVLMSCNTGTATCTNTSCSGGWC